MIHRPFHIRQSSQVWEGIELRTLKPNDAPHQRPIKLATTASRMIGRWSSCYALQNDISTLQISGHSKFIVTRLYDRYIAALLVAFAAAAILAHAQAMQFARLRFQDTDWIMLAIIRSRSRRSP